MNVIGTLTQLSHKKASLYEENHKTEAKARNIEERDQKFWQIQPTNFRFQKSSKLWSSSRLLLKYFVASVVVCL